MGTFVVGESGDGGLIEQRAYRHLYSINSASATELGLDVTDVGAYRPSCEPSPAQPLGARAMGAAAVSKVCMSVIRLPIPPGTG